VRGASEYHPKRAFSTQRLLLRVLLNGLGDAVRRFDQPAADRYRRRISQIAGHFETNAQVSQELERLLWISGQWLATKAPNRYEAEQQVVELIDRVAELL
jgi:hypothetical protein